MCLWPRYSVFKDSAETWHVLVLCKHNLFYLRRRIHEAAADLPRRDPPGGSRADPEPWN